MSSRSFHRVLLIALVGCGLAGVSLAQLDVRITTGHPPAIRHEHHPPSPGAGYVWVGGYWNDEGGRWDWVPGRWDRPDVSGAYWITPRYVHSQGSYIYEPGHWSSQTLVVGEDVRNHRAWKHHERDHEREMEKEHHRSNYEHDHDRDH